MGRVSGKRALVTGGGSGLGAAQCEMLASEGAQVVVADINMDGASAVAEKIKGAGGQALALSLNVTSEEEWAEAVDATVDRFGGLEVVVNNAGIAIPANVETTTMDIWRKTLAVNLDGVFLGTRAAIGYMKDHEGGSIINISSIEGIIGEPGAAAYNASKGGVRIFTKSAALHCAAEGYAIRVNSVHPGYILTAMVSGAVAQMPQDEAKAFQDRILGAIPLGRMGEPDEIAYGVLFLASDESRYMTGSELVIDGGYTAQ
ncbi:3-beta hydroxysteroid dehydrogenase [Lujinxingia litoralis]|uniref:3-beta hydroxysteroid dehydrogenase n=1 Tax=Lujinxingia litoralis TaxID=2211119 RepID=A0A328CCY9_9DELT|nr:glucose 1-dehydrogenase [Lujinxingia litoralis]RAL25161.1 3-beta hydroxysteroid dehydrogenase [Lujinxingia litoralis]